MRIIDEIDALVDEQLAQESSGYDHNLNQPRCRCGEEWHGLPITAAMQEMRSWGQVDDDYSFATDDSAILCPGSGVEGPLPAPARKALTDWSDWRSAWYGAPVLVRPESREARWWRCDSPQLLEVEVNTERQELTRNLEDRLRLRMVERGAARISGGPEIVLYADTQNGANYIRYGVDENRRPTFLELHCIGRPSVGEWHLVESE